MGVETGIYLVKSHEYPLNSLNLRWFCMYT